MKTKTKALLLSLCAVLLVAATVFTTVAYLTSKDEVKNTFTIGKVNIKLDEAKVDEAGNAIEDADRVKENSYKLLPGHTYTKDPTVTVLEGSEEAYLRLKITLTNAKAVMDMCIPEEWRDDLDEYQDRTYPLIDLLKIDDMSAFFWSSPMHPDNGQLSMIDAANDPKYCVYDEATDTITYIFYYNNQIEDKDTVSALDGDVVIPALFETIQVPEWATAEQLAALEGFQINVVAEAIQADGFANADAAWAAYDA